MAANNLYRNYIIHPSPESGNTINPVVGLHDGLYEFDEADIWNSNAASALEIKKMIPTSRLSKKVVRKIDRTPVTTCASLPVNVPDWSKIYKDIEYREHRHQKKELDDGNFDGDSDYEDDDDDDQDGRVPPHEYLARRRGASFSVHEGAGRTLKGRDLRQVRNAIWKRVGFED
ncbi:hypothetical protein Tsubulata_000177 [Turnera subulata]|uniref:Senescence regulator S40 n=1 Tax=Turnera subulata TaxID=218843 RepID=A0A9Q0GCS7_9ROSI|nr:hypothetical protein Tsubulata_000177 [Turnera subulata]